MRNFAISELKYKQLTITIMAQIKNILSEIEKTVVNSEREAYGLVEKAFKANGLTAVPSMEQAEKLFKDYDLPMPYGVQSGEDYYMTLQGEELEDGGWQPSYKTKVIELYTDAALPEEDYLYLIHIEEI